MEPMEKRGFFSARRRTIPSDIGIGIGIPFTGDGPEELKQNQPVDVDALRTLELLDPLQPFGPKAQFKYLKKYSHIDIFNLLKASKLEFSATSKNGIQYKLFAAPGVRKNKQGYYQIGVTYLTKDDNETLKDESEDNQKRALITKIDFSDLKEIRDTEKSLLDSMESLGEKVFVP